MPKVNVFLMLALAAPAAARADGGFVSCRISEYAYAPQGAYYSKELTQFSEPLVQRPDGYWAFARSFELPGAQGFQRVDVSVESSVGELSIGWFYWSKIEATYRAPLVISPRPDPERHAYRLDAPVEDAILGNAVDADGNPTDTPWQWLHVGCDVHRQQ
jgi:hypothetical protein